MAGQDERLGVIDFEETGYGLAVQDIVWLLGVLWTRCPDLQEVFLGGFGRGLSDDEHRVLVLLTARLAISSLVTGWTKHDQVLTERGQGVLAFLVRALT